MSQVPATEADMQFTNTGLEDFGVSDAVLPRIKIVHEQGVWKDNLAGIEMQQLRFIALGLVKQRVLFHHKVDTNDVPMCKSSDFNLGYPNLDAPQQKSFPWDLSGFDPNDFQPDAEGQRKLPCEGCQLKEWGSNPASDAPYCSEQWTIPIYYETSGSPDGDDWAPAILTLQKSSIKPIRTYFTSFAQANKPPFLSIGRGTLRTQVRGSVTYSIPSFVKEGESDRGRWQEFSNQFGEMRSFLTRPPTRENDQPTNPSENVYGAPAQQEAPAPAAEPQQAPPSSQNDFWAAPPQQTQQAPPPQQTQPPQQPAPQQAPPPQQPAPQQAPPPQQPAPQQTQPQQPAGNELPF